MFLERKEIVLFLTGFGKFGEILHNPTTKISESFAQILEENPIPNLKLHKNYVITVSIEDCDEALKDIYRQIDEMIKQDSEQGAQRHYLVVHFGVYNKSGRFNVEYQGKNIKNFFIPDERGNKPRGECIDTCHPLEHCMENRLNIDGFVCSLKKMGFTCEKSFSAGEYICNYTYYCSLKCKSMARDPQKVDALFCHVPSFEEIEEATQKRFARELVNQIVLQLSN